jgi:hypothetical protein
MRIFTVLLLLFAFCSVAWADVLMYRDDAGKWHGVNSILEVPDKYKDQVSAVEENSSSIIKKGDESRETIPPSTRKEIDEENRITSLKGSLKNNLDEIFSKLLLGKETIPGWTITNYQIIDVEMSDEYHAKVRAKLILSNFEYGDRTIFQIIDLTEINGVWTMED